MENKSPSAGIVEGVHFASTKDRSAGARIVEGLQFAAMEDKSPNAKNAEGLQEILGHLQWWMWGRLYAKQGR